MAHDGHELEYTLGVPFASIDEDQFLDLRFKGSLTPIALPTAIEISRLTDRKMILDVKGSTEVYIQFLEFIQNQCDAQVLKGTAVLQAYTPDEIRLAGSAPVAGILGATWKYGISPYRSNRDFEEFVRLLESSMPESVVCMSVPYAYVEPELEAMSGPYGEVAKRFPVYVHGHPIHIEQRILEAGFGVFSHLSPATSPWTQRNELTPEVVSAIYEGVLGRQPENEAVVQQACNEQGLTIANFGRRVLESVEFTRRYEHYLVPGRREQLAVSPPSFDGLFDAESPAYFSEAAGVTNAKFIQYTNLAERVVAQILNVFDFVNLEYYVFAGSMVGYVRDRRAPRWLDDVDVVIFEDQIDRFHAVAAPMLRSAGFQVVPAHDFPDGGYQVVAMQAGSSRRDGVQLSETLSVPIPWAQVDVFFTTVDSGGYLRNLGGWGLYHRMDIPEKWVRPASTVFLHGGARPAFAEYERDILREYGDVHRNIIIASHDRDSRRMEIWGTPWIEIRGDFERRYLGEASLLPPGVQKESVERFAPIAGSSGRDKDCDNLEAICRTVLLTRPETFRLTSKDNLFWIMDLKRIFPQVRFEAELDSVEHVPRATLVAEFLTGIYAERSNVKDAIRDSLATLAVTNGAGGHPEARFPRREVRG